MNPEESKILEGAEPLPERKPLPDCVNCNAAGCTGSCSGGGCGTGGCGGCAAKDDDSTPAGACAKGTLTPADFKFNADKEPRGKIFATDWLGDISTSADYPIAQVQFKNTRTGFYVNPQKINLEIGDIVAVEASPGHDIGRVSMVGPLVAMQLKKHRVDPDQTDLKKIFRIATPQDIERFEEARQREHSTMIRSRVIAEELGLDMKIGDVEFQGDGSKAIFYYIADERVDFRKLIRLLADEFRVRIEMKQIGARQEAGRIGGIGPCGRPLCCSSWMTHFVSVGTGAARMQDLSMNPQKLAGQCAKLKCCLNFEIDTYAESARKLPARDVVLETKDADYFYFKSDILQRQVTYSTDKRIPANLVTIPAARAFEIIALNKQGIKVDRLQVEKDDEPAPREYIDLTDQDSLTRFDRTRKNRRNKSKNKTESKENNDSRPKVEQKPKNESKPKGEQKPKGEPKPKGEQKPKGEVKPKGDQKSKGEQRPQNDRKPKNRPNKGRGSQRSKGDSEYKKS